MLNQDIEYFLAVAECSSLARAAQRLGLSQPALSKAVQRIERRAGTVLLLRTAQGSELTEAGRAFCMRMRSIAQTVEDALQEARDLGGGHAGQLKIGLIPAAVAFTLNVLLPALQQERPAATFSFLTGFSDHLEQALQRKEIDMLLGPLSTHNPEFESELLFDDPYSFLLNASHPLANCEGVTLEQMAQCQWVSSPTHEYARGQMEEAMRRHGLRRPTVAVEVNSVPALLLAISRTNLVSIINSRSIMPGHLPHNVRLMTLLEPAIHCPVAMTWRRGYISAMMLRAQQLLRDAEGGENTALRGHDRGKTD